MKAGGNGFTPVYGRPRRRARVAAALVSGAFALALSACASSPLETYELGAVPFQAVSQPKLSVISIAEPNAPAILATNRIAIRRGSSDYAYLAGAQWSNVLTQLVQRRIMDSFENAHLFRAVADTGTASDYILSTDIRRFEVDGNQAVVEIAVRLITARTGRTLRGTIVTGTSPSPTSGAAGITAAIDAAFGQAADKILKFAVSQT